MTYHLRIFQEHLGRERPPADLCSCGRVSTISQSWKKPRSVTVVAMPERTKLLAPSAPMT
ncbi:hypothetical protein [Kitasatospora sp. NPDC057198]|uniref:hypothetical protein n=1 Tax=Kitasatospora sp. NPDC057198 TaxID=3346046 RepID=UPI00362E268A